MQSKHYFILSFIFIGKILPALTPSYKLCCVHKWTVLTFIVYFTLYTLEAFPLSCGKSNSIPALNFKEQKEIMQKVHLNSEKLLTYGELTFKELHSCHALLSKTISEWQMRPFLGVAFLFLGSQTKFAQGRIKRKYRDTDSPSFPRYTLYYTDTFVELEISGMQGLMSPRLLRACIY